MRTLLATSLLCLFLAAPAAQAQQQRIDLSGFDPAEILAGANDVLLRAPDASLDRLFQAVHASSKIPGEAKVLCALFDADADRSLVGFQRAANTLGPSSRERFVGAVTEVATLGLQSPRQPYDPVAARQVLKSSGVTAMLLHEGFMAGMTATGDDPASRAARCQSFQQMLGVLKDQPLAQRASATRFLLNEGLSIYGNEL